MRETGPSILENRLLRKLFPLVAIIFAAFLLYSNIYQAPFAFDGRGRIMEETKIRDLGNFLSLKELLKPRGVVDLTFALNYRFGELNPRGYHLVNILIHILNGWVVFFLAQHLFKRLWAGPESKGSPPADPVPDVPLEVASLVAALIFVAHPIQTQGVTYTVQRYASMAALFYMVAVLAYMKARTAAQGTGRRAQGLYFFLCGLCGMLAFLSKQNTASLPGVILLVEFLCFDRTWSGWKRKLPWFAAVFVLWFGFVLMVSGLFSAGAGGRGLLEDVSELMQETETVGRWEYLCTQFNVLVIYIRLLFVPVGQNLDWVYPFKRGFLDGLTPLAFLGLAGLAGVGVWQRRRRPVISLGIFWFFITLSVESSIIPIRDALFEHRLYLPMFGLGFSVSYLLFHWFGRRRSWALTLSVLFIVSLGTATYLRNRVWQDEAVLWADVIAKNSRNPRGQNNLGDVLARRGQIREALPYFQEAVRIKEDYAVAQSNLGNALARAGRHEEGEAYLRRALEIDPDYANAHSNLGVVLQEQGKYDAAIHHLKEALRIQPDHAEAHYNLGNTFLAQGRWEEAAERYSRALRSRPTYARAHNNLGIALMRQGKTDAALEQYMAALRIDPKLGVAHNNLGSALFRQDRTKEAEAHLLEAVRINPQDEKAHHNLGTLLAREGRLEEAVSHYSEAVRIHPGYAEAHHNLANALSRLDRTGEAVEHLQEALRLKPDRAKTHWDLAQALERQGRTDEAIHHCAEAVRLGLKEARLYNTLGALLTRAGRAAEAVTHFRAALEVMPEYAEAHNNLGSALARQGKFEEALAHFDEAVRIRPDYTEAERNRALCLKMLGKKH